MAKQHVSTIINGEPVEYLCEPQQTLLDVLRDELNLTGSKEGCSSGDCGACTVIVDGNIVCSCLMLGAEAEGRKITTIEGIAEGEKLHPVQQKFLEHAALQCGFCTPGFIVAAKALLDAEPEPDRGRDALLAGRQPVPLHRLRQDHPRRARRRRGNASGGSAMSYLDKDSAEGRRHPADPPRRRRQGHRPRQFRRRHGDARHAVGQDQAQPARARPHRLDQHRQGDGAARRQGRDHARRFPRHPAGQALIGAAPHNLWDLSRNCMAKGKALYEGHAVAAVAATSPAIAEAGARPDRGRIRGAAACHGCRGGDGAGCAGAARRHLYRGGRTQADQAVERRQDGPLCQGRCRGRVRRSRNRHRAALHDKAGAPGLYRAACLRRLGREPTGKPRSGARARASSWSAPIPRGLPARDIANIRAIPAEIGGGFGGKTIIYLEPSPTCCRRSPAGRSRS